MKVALLKSRAAKPGGLEKTASRIAQGFVEKGAKVSILTTGKTVNFCNLPVHAMQTIKWPGFVRMEQFDRNVEAWLANNPQDIVFGMDRNRNQTHIRAGNGVHAAFLKSRLLTEGRLKYLSCLINPLHRKILDMERRAFENPNLKKAFANSRMVKRQMLEHYSIDPAKIQVIHNGVEWDEMREDFEGWHLQKLECCARFGLDPDQFHLLFIGNGYLRKGLAPLLEGLAYLKRKDVHLSVIGYDRHQPFFEKMAGRLHVNVRFFGSQTDLRHFYQYADALAIPSFYDPFANVTLEALAMGLFVVSSQSNGGSEVLTPGTGSVIEDLCSRESVADSLEFAFAQPKTKANSRIRRASVEHLDYSKQTKLLIDACLA